MKRKCRYTYNLEKNISHILINIFSPAENVDNIKIRFVYIHYIHVLQFAHKYKNQFVTKFKYWIRFFDDIQWNLNEFSIQSEEKNKHITLLCTYSHTADDNIPLPSHTHILYAIYIMYTFTYSRVYMYKAHTYYYIYIRTCMMGMYLRFHKKMFHKLSHKCIRTAHMRKTTLRA